MKFRNFLDVSRTSQQAYFKEGVDLLYPDLRHTLKIAILPAYDAFNPGPTSWVPAVNGDEESDFYCTVRAAKFVGHGNRRNKVSFLSPRTFDLDADDPYEAFYDYCSRSDKWSYLTKDHRGKRQTGEVEGAIFPRVRNYFVANVMDVTAGSRGGVFVTELSESVAKNILYSLRKGGGRVDGIAFARNDKGELAYGDITNPKSALVIEIAYGGKGYVARPAVDHKGQVMRVEIPSVLLQHRKHMEEPGTFIMKPESGQDIVDRLAGMLRGYRSEDGKDEIEALEEAMAFAYGGKYTVNENAEEKDDPFANAVKDVADAEPEAKADAVSDAIDRGVSREKYTPVNIDPEKMEKVKIKAKPIMVDNERVKPIVVNDDTPPGEEISPADISAMRAMLAGGN